MTTIVFLTRGRRRIWPDRVSGYYDDVVDGERVMVIYDACPDRLASQHGVLPGLARDLRDSLRSQLLTAALLVPWAHHQLCITHMFKHPINLLLQGIDKVKRDLSVSRRNTGVMSLAT